MKIGILQIFGSLLLLACMVFAAAKIESADHWIHLWVPVVVAGVGLVFVGIITQKNKSV